MGPARYDKSDPGPCAHHDEADPPLKKEAAIRVAEGAGAEVAG